MMEQQCTVRTRQHRELHERWRLELPAGEGRHGDGGQAPKQDGLGEGKPMVSVRRSEDGRSGSAVEMSGDGGMTVAEEELRWCSEPGKGSTGKILGR